MNISPTTFAILGWVQGVCYVVTGVGPLVSIRTFEAVTGRKTDNGTGREADHWLVYTVGALVTVISAALITAANRREPTPKVVVLACGSALALTAVDLIYVARRLIPPIYLEDAVVEIALLVA